MLRKVLGVGAGTLVLLGTLCILWAGLNWPPPLWVLKYGLPSSQHPTGKTITVEEVTFVMISPGYFRMGSDWLTAHPRDDYEPDCTRGNVTGRLCEEAGLLWGEWPRPSSEMPVHWVQFRRDFGIAKTETTNAEYERFDPNHQRTKYSKGDRDPVVHLNWNDARHYCRWLSRVSGLEVHLPSEAEWECACRAGTQKEYVTGDTPGEISQYAWFGGNSGDRAHNVATRAGNAWGLFDLEGNVLEWTEDEPHRFYGTRSLVSKMKGVTASKIPVPEPVHAWLTKGGETRYRIVRGRSWADTADSCRSAYRIWLDSTWSSRDIGVRPALSLPSDR